MESVLEWLIGDLPVGIGAAGGVGLVILWRISQSVDRMGGVVEHEAERTRKAVYDSNQEHRSAHVDMQKILAHIRARLNGGK